MPRSTRQIPSETRKANLDSSSLRESLILMISREDGTAVCHPCTFLRHHSQYPPVVILPPSLDDRFAAIARLLSEVSYRCHGALPVILATGFFSLCRCPLTALFVSSLVVRNEYFGPSISGDTKQENE